MFHKWKQIGKFLIFKNQIHLIKWKIIELFEIVRFFIIFFYFIFYLYCIHVHIFTTEQSIQKSLAYFFEISFATLIELKRHCQTFVFTFSSEGKFIYNFPKNILFSFVYKCFSVNRVNRGQIHSLLSLCGLCHPIVPNCFLKNSQIWIIFVKF